MGMVVGSKRDSERVARPDPGEQRNVSIGMTATHAYGSQTQGFRVWKLLLVSVLRATVLSRALSRMRPSGRH